MRLDLVCQLGVVSRGVKPFLRVSMNAIIDAFPPPSYFAFVVSFLLLLSV